jgi:hypothetical protein
MINKYQQLGKKLSGKEMKQVQGGFVQPGEGCVSPGGRCTNGLECCNPLCPNDPFQSTYCVNGRCILACS